MPANRRARVWLGVSAAVVLLLGLVILGIFITRSGSQPPAASPAPVAQTPPVTAPPTTAPAASAASTEIEYANDRIRREIATQGLTVDRARSLFALEVAPMPGVTVPEGPVRETFSGSYALSQLVAVRDQLTPEQRAWLHTLLDVKQSVPLEKPATMPAFPPRPPFEVPTIRPAAYRLDDPDVPPATFTLKYLHELYDWANNAVSALTGEAKVPAFDIAFKQFTQPNEKKAWIISGTWNDDTGERLTTSVNGQEVNVCHSFVDWRKFEAWPMEVHLSVVVHEVVHCYQQIASPSASAVASTWGWLQDGEATWAQMAIVPTAAFTSLQTHWTNYLSTPRGHLFARKYDAAGFFGHVVDVIGPAGVDVVGKRLIPTFRAGADGANEAAFQVLTAGVSDGVLDTWASSYFRTHEDKFLWTAKGPGKVNFPSDKARPDPLSVGPGEQIPLPTVEPWELGLYRLESSADIVLLVNAKGHLSLIDQGEQVNKSLLPMQPIYLCMRGECKCPPDTDGQVPETVHVTPAIEIGVTAGPTGTLGWLVGQSLDEHCRPKAPNQPMGKLPNGITGGGITGGEPATGKVTSDPHLNTLDGRWYDLQAIGEFVLTRSATDFTPDAFAVHVRFGRIGELSTVSVATAMAVRVGHDRVSVSIDRGSAPVPKLRVNGVLATQDFVPLAAGSVRAVFDEGGTGYLIELLDGTRVGVSSFARQGLNVWVEPSPARKGKLTGLLGDHDGNKANDPVVRGTSTVLGATPGYDELYTKFGNSWRVSQQESLLDYADNETTETFTDRAFPDRSAPALDAAALASAEASCKAGGILHVDLLRNCAFDLASTGNRRYVRAYQPQQQRGDLATLLAGGLRGNGVVTSPNVSGRTRSVVLEGRVTQAAEDAFAPFQGFKGDTIYLDPDGCQKPRFLEILGPDNKQIAGNAPPCGLRLTLPADGTYRMSLNRFHDFTGPYRLPIVVVRPDRVTRIKIGDALTGTLGMRAEQDVFLVEMTSPGALTLGGATCTANGEVAIYFGDGETNLVGIGPACRIGKVTLPKAGTYRIVINPYNNTTGPYTIPTS